MSNPTKEAVLDAIRNVASMTTSGRLTRKVFLAQSGMKVSDIFRYFPKWSDALCAAGLSVEPYNQKIDIEDLLKDWGTLVRKHRQIPTRNVYKLQGKYSPGVFETNFGSWSAIPSRFRDFALHKPEWADVLALLPVKNLTIESTNDSLLTNSSISEAPTDFAFSSKRAKKNKQIIHDFVDLDRISELRGIASSSFDLAKLIRLCEELNSCYDNGNYYAVGMLVRAILDHVPTIFGRKNFAEIANNYSGGGRSFKKVMQHLENSSRNIADLYLHTQARSKEILPNKTQVNFSNDLDLLLAEIIRVLK